MSRNVKCTSFVVMVLRRPPHATGETQKVKSARASPLAFSSITSQPRSFSYTPKMARSAKCAFCVAMALGHARQATGEILTGKSGLPELALLLSASLPVGLVTPPRSEPLHCHSVLCHRRHQPRPDRREVLRVRGGMAALPGG
jgi:hypothetical protein